MSKVLAISCPVCGFRRSYKINDVPFRPKVVSPILKINEVGGKIKTGRGVGRGKAKGRIEVVDTFDINKIPSKYQYIRKGLENRVKKVSTILSSGKSF